jgi:hypothetical protein
VPKKRGPKTDVLEALLKRVDGLEKRLVSEGKSDDLSEANPAATTATPSTTQDKTNADTKPADGTKSQPLHPSPHASANSTSHASQLMSPIEPR